MQKVYKTLLKSEPERAREQLEDLAVRLSPRDYAGCARLRAVAEELVRRGLEVTARCSRHRRESRSISEVR